MVMAMVVTRTRAESEFEYCILRGGVSKKKGLKKVLIRMDRGLEHER